MHRRFGSLIHRRQQVLFELLEPSAASAGAASPGTSEAALPACTASPAVEGGGAAGGSGWMSLPHRVVWAVASLDSVLLYDSQHAQALAAPGRRC